MRRRVRRVIRFHPLRLRHNLSPKTGFSGALMGNTAEVVLDTLESDVLVLKPNDIIDHLEDLVRH